MSIIRNTVSKYGNRTALKCDDCGTESEAEEKITGTNMRRKMEELGWSHTVGKDRCLPCTEKKYPNGLPAKREGRR